MFAKCKRGNDNATRGQHCDSVNAVRLSPASSNVVIFKCTKCSFSWSVPIGGSVVL